MGGCELPRTMEYYALSNIIPSLIGQISYRLLREQGALEKELYHKYEELRAKKLWMFWSKKNIICPYNSIIPKGEVGLNPAYPSLSYSIHKAKLDKNTKKLRICEKLNVQLLPSLTSIEKYTLRGS